MGRQFGFIMDSKDEKYIIEQLMTSGSFYYESGQDEPIICDNYPDNNWVLLYYYMDIFGEMTFHYNKAGFKYINIIDAPVIEFSHTIIDEDNRCISEGRLYFNKSYYKDDELVYKSSEIESVYKQIVKMIKNRLKKVEIQLGSNVKKIYVSESLVDSII